MITELHYQDFVQAKQGHRGRLPGLTLVSFQGYQVSVESLEKRSLVTHYRIKNSFTFYDRTVILFGNERAIVKKKTSQEHKRVVLHFVFVLSKSERTETGTYAQ